ncbi:MAG: beta-galactosidase, partial [Brachybacterium sp.]|nr:beta-galactosidase [Brachybacterium sp.]
MSLSTEGSTLVDEHGRQRILHGINLVAKGSPGVTDPSAFRGSWTGEDLAQLQDIGLDSVRLGVNWSATEPRPGDYSPEHLDWLAQQLDLLHAAGLAVILDGHQDLFSQSFGNGAPAWATLTTQRFEATELWSDAYLSSPAVHEALD